MGTGVPGIMIYGARGYTPKGGDYFAEREPHSRVNQDTQNL